MQSSSRLNLNCMIAQRCPTLLRFVVLFAVALAIAVAASDGAEARTRSYAVMDFESGIILSAVNENERLHPASLTKMMTLYLTFEAIQDGRFSLDQRVRVSKRAASMPPSRLGLRAGERVHLRHLISSAAVRSANDAAVVLAETVGGTEWKFAEMMTRKARSFGMNGTTFRNATGFTAEGHLSTARDMAILGRRLLRDFPEHAGTFRRLSIRWGGRILRATNSRFLQGFKGADGIKTGYTRAAGYTIVGTAERNGRRLITSYFGASSSSSRTSRVAELMNQGFSQLGKAGTLVAQPVTPPKARPGAPSAEPPALALAAAPTQPELPPRRPETLPAPAQPGQAAVANAPRTTGIPLASPDDLKETPVEASKAPEPTGNPSASAPPDGWSIQVGAYARKEQAEARLRSVNGAHADITGDATQMASKGRRYYLAQFGGFDRNGAKLACRALRSRKIDCLPIVPTKTTEPVVVAATAERVRAGMPGQWAIQVGAYSREEQAAAHLHNVSVAHRDITGGATPLTPRRNRYYLVQFAGFDEDDAKSACGALRNRGVDCLPIISSASPGVIDAASPATVALPRDNRQWVVQVGAYSRKEQAEAHLRNVSGQHADVTGNAVPLTPKQRHYYLAQFAGFGADEAKTACGTLRKRGVDCLPIAPSGAGEPAAVAAAAETVLRRSPGEWAVQVGAYSRKEQAEAHLRNVSGAHADITGDAKQMTPMRNRYYLAQFAGFGADEARTACGTLRKRGVDCLPIAPSDAGQPAAVAAAPEAVLPRAPGEWAVQVGAYARKEQAEAHLRNMGGAHSDITANATPMAPKRNRYYLAQFAGYDESGANAACTAFRKRGIDCLPIAPSDAKRPVAETVVAETAQPPASGQWAVQVGAFDRARRARAQIDRLRSERLPHLEEREFRVARSGKLFLAWFTGFDEKSAQEACRALEERRTDCLAVRTGRERIGGSLASESGWTVQVGAFRRDRDASLHLERIRKAGLDKLDGREGTIHRRGRYYLVQFEPYSAAEARATCEFLLKRGIDCLAKSSQNQDSRAAGRSDWAIQVGAYRRATQARAQLNRVMGKSLVELEGARHWVPQQGRLYLARLRNLSKQSANAACDALRSDGMDCLPLAPSRN